MVGIEVDLSLDTTEIDLELYPFKGSHALPSATVLLAQVHKYLGGNNDILASPFSSLPATQKTCSQPV